MDDKLAILLQQIDYTSTDYFIDGTIERVVVHKEQRIWHFYFVLKTVLPATVYELFHGKLKNAFQHIASIKVTIRTEQKEIIEPLESYWSIFLEQVDASPPMMTILREIPRAVGNKIIVAVQNEPQGEALKSRFQEVVLHTYQSFGFPFVQLETEVKVAPEQYEQFLEQRQKEDDKHVEGVLIEVAKEKQESVSPSGSLTIGYAIKPQEQVIRLESILEEERSVVIEGYVFESEVKELKSGRTLLTFKITDYTNSILVKRFSRDKEDATSMEQVKKGMWLKVRGSVQNDTFVRDLVMIGNDINEIKPEQRMDTAKEGEKRVELHLHTPMSQMDAMTPISKLVEQAKKWGHTAIALTDHAIAQSFPEAYNAGKKHGIKILYGIEANLVNDGVSIVYNEQHRSLSEETYIVFDVETTGLSAVYNAIIELAAVKMREGEIIDRFERFANPHHPLSQTTTDLTGITDEMVENAPDIGVVLKEFYEWIGEDTLIAHNASFDIGFLNVGLKKLGLEKVKNPVIDTLELARMLHPELKNHRLNTLCKRFSIDLTQHHRAIYDAEATGYLLVHLLKEAAEKDIHYQDELNTASSDRKSWKQSRPFHTTLIAQDNEGLKNLFKLISIAHMNYFYRVPRIPRSVLQKYRKGILVGSACDKGELFEGMMQKSPEEVETLAGFYDYIELQPPAVYAHLLELELVRDERALHDIMKKLVAVGEKLDIPVVATGNVHYLNKEDKIYRKILISSQGGANPLNRHRLPDVHFRTTDEMLEAFSFLGEEKAKEVVVTNTNLIADKIGEVKPIKDELYTPKIEGSDEEIRQITYKRARELYGETLPEIVEKRIEKELSSIIGYGFAVIYLISHKLVKKSLDDGYLVGSRGSIGSSLVATLTDITEVNPLAPHYICPSCQYSEFFDDGSVSSGFDLPDKNCPTCNTKLIKEGQNIPFETFLGFKGDKVPDIDLNFSGEYQPKAHQYTKELFGEDNVYRAGTIGTVADKTAFGYVKAYTNDHQLTLRGAEVERLALGCTGVKRTTGQHPGGIIVIPDYMDVYDFTPIQFPADDTSSEWKTTHFDFHSIHDNVLKLDILGHDDPTMIRMLQDLSGISPKDIPIDDKEVMKIFSGTESLGVTSEQIQCRTGTLGIPEFGTRFVRQMLEDTRPSTFSELIQISGLSHGTGVWLGNAQELIQNEICTLSEVIGCRDEIMVYLMHRGLEPSLAFKITESVRKGKGLTPEFMDEMKKNNVPDWYIDSCLKIKYMFPKGHAAAYVLMAVRIAYFKVHYPLFYYAAYFTIRAGDFELDVMKKGSAAILNKINEINSKGLEASPKEKSTLTVLEICLEMCERGFSFTGIDLYRSKAAEFMIDGNSLVPPFDAIPGLGKNVAENIVNAREEREFLSKEDLQQRGKVSKTLIEYLDTRGCLAALPDENQLSLF